LWQLWQQVLEFKQERQQAASLKHLETIYLFLSMSFNEVWNVLKQEREGGTTYVMIS